MLASQVLNVVTLYRDELSMTHQLIRHSAQAHMFMLPITAADFTICLTYIGIILPVLGGVLEPFR